MEHVEGDILLTMPKIPELNDPAITDDMLLKNKDIVEQMEEVVMLWEKHIQKVNINFFLCNFYNFEYLIAIYGVLNVKKIHNRVKIIYYFFNTYF